MRKAKSQPTLLVFDCVNIAAESSKYFKREYNYKLFYQTSICINLVTEKIVYTGPKYLTRSLLLAGSIVHNKLNTRVNMIRSPTA